MGWKSRGVDNPWRLPGFAVDVALALGLTAAVAVAIAVSQENARDPDVPAYCLAFAMGALALVRRRWPLAVLLGTAALLMAYYSLDYPGITPAVPLSVALGTAAASSRLRWSLAVAVFFLVVEFVARHSAVAVVLGDVVRDGALLLAVILLGVTAHSRAERLAEAHARFLQEQARQRLLVEQLAAEERVRIAQDVHDIVGHAITAIMVQAALAEDVFDSAPEQARGALRSVRRAGREALGELRSTVHLLRSGAPLDGAPSLDRLDELVEAGRAAGLTVVTHREGRQRPVPAVVSTAVFRIAQEALTNVVKHAQATTVQIRIDYRADTLSLEVIDDGTGMRAPAGWGHGLTGMTERAASVGGRLETSLADRGGFRVHAQIPLAEYS